MIFTPTAFFNTPSTDFVYYGATGPNSINLGFQKWFKGVQSTTYSTDPIPSSSYTITARSIENAASSSAYSVPSGQLFQMTGSVSGSGTLANGFLGSYPNQVGDERAGNGVGYCMLVQGPSDLRTNPLNSMPRPIAQRIKVRSASNNNAFNYIDATGSVVTKTLTSGVDYFIDVQGVWSQGFEQNTSQWTTIALNGPATGSFTAYVEGTRQYTATRTKGTGMTLNWVKQFTTASMDMQNAGVSATTYTFTAALPPNASNFAYGWSGSAII
jgi:hypothetical protein